MSKSMGNFFTLRDLLDKGFTGREIRYQLLAAHYREPFNFTLDGLAGTRNALARLDESLERLREIAADAKAPAEVEILDEFTACLDDDLNVSAAWGLIFDWVRDYNRAIVAGQVPPARAASAIAAWESMDDVLGLGRPAAGQAPPEVIKIVEARHAARKNRDFKQADTLRIELLAKGWVIEDTSKGPRVKRVSKAQ